MERPAAHQRVTRILPLAHGHQRDPVRQPVVGRSLSECTARSIRPSSIASSICRVKSARLPICESGTCCTMSPVVRTSTRTVSYPAAWSRARTCSVCQSASALAARADAERRAHRPPDPAAAGSAAKWISN